MRLLILHLSDAHLASKENQNPVLARVHKIADVVNEHAHEVSGCLIVFSGDLTQAGTAGELALARKFIEELQADVKTKLPGKPVLFAVAPGNHDCDFTKAHKARQLVIDNLSQEARPDVDESVVSTCTEVQTGFFELLDSVAKPTSVPSDRLLWRTDCQIDGKVVRANCYNTAWVSRLNEKKGQITYPIDIVPPPDTQVDLVVSVFHHPYAWFNSEAQHLFRRYIEGNSDLVLTGHEHDPVIGEKSTNDGTNLTYSEGPALQTKRGWVSQFNVMLVDLTSSTVLLAEYAWQRELYRSFASRKLPFLRNERLRRDAWSASSTFAAWLDDPGATYTHRLVGQLKLRDVYIAPELSELQMGESSPVPFRTIDGNHLGQYVTEKKMVAVLGAEKSGKTTLAKSTFLALLKAGQVPVLLEGNSIREPDGLPALVERRFKYQYSEDALTRYRQLDHVKKTLLVDDFDEVATDTRMRSNVVSALRAYADQIIVFCDDMALFEEIVEQAADQPSYLSEFSVCAITEMKLAARDRMIKRWLTLGSHEDTTGAMLLPETARIARTVDTILQKSLVPAYPVFLLTILQSYEAQTPATMVAGSYGYFYEVLITRALAGSKTHWPVDAKYNFLAELAHAMYSKSVSRIDMTFVTKVCQDYYDKYAILFDATRIMADLARAGIFSGVLDTYRFRYSYLYYYFVARYFARTLQKEQSAGYARGQVELLISQVYRTDYANIIMFLSYLSRDEFLIRAMLVSASNVLPGFEPADLDTDIDFTQALWGHPDFRAVLEHEEPEKSRERALIEKDGAPDTVGNLAANTDGDAESSHASILGLNQALRTMQLLGQVARNFAGSLEADIKKELVSSAYSIALRSLRFLLNMVETNLSVFRELFVTLLRKPGAESSSERLQNRADRLIYMLVYGICYQMIERISVSVGTEELRDIYDQILAEQDRPSVRLISIAVKLGSERFVPEQDILDTRDAVKEKLLRIQLLQAFVIARFRLFGDDYRVKQRVCQELGIGLVSRQSQLPSGTGKLTHKPKGH